MKSRQQRWNGRVRLSNVHAMIVNAFALNWQGSTLSSMARLAKPWDEELADIDTRLTNARTRLADLEYEVAVLKRLGEALEIARASARDRYVEPVMQELVPLLRLFWPEAQLRFDPVTLLPSALMRAGAEENFDILSGGTQEQIALLVRLAFARMLAKNGYAGSNHP